MTRGLLIGTFDPPHAGHLFLCDTARAMVDALTILVRAAPDASASLAQRVIWLRALFPDLRVVAQDPAIGDWPAIARAAHPEPIDILFAPDDLDAGLARELGAWPAVIDPAHETVPVSSAAVRADPIGHWRYLPAPVRADHAMTICLHGPESTGKSTLAPLLARHFGTIHVPEYGRIYCERFGLDLTMDDLVTIGRTHDAMTQAARRRCDRRLILDTDPLMTAVWADMLFGRRDPWFDAFDATANLYLLLDIDLPWVDDGTRFFGDETRRRRFFDLAREELERRGLPYAVIGGPSGQRFDRALEAIVAAGLG